jgi:NAD(P)H-dependent flavin oxidoreductase YrpB (nitropropane dioxygenase family)
VRGKVGLLTLLGEVVEAVSVPVVAAGGIGTARAMGGALAAGAEAVRVGTRFVAAEESPAHPQWVEALIEAEPEDTVLTEAFSVMWPSAPHRVLCSCVEAAEAFEGDVVGEMKLSVPCPSRETTGSIEAMALYAGQSVGAVRSVQPAAEIVRELAEGAERLLKQRAPALA